MFMKYQKLILPKTVSKGPILTDQELEIKELCESSLYAFMRVFWPTMDKGREFIDGWAIDALCEHLEALYTLDIQNLIVNMPPRTSKSTTIAVGYPAWLWIKDPRLRFIYTAYSQTLSVRDSVGCRRLITSNLYQKLWGNSYSLMKDVNHKLRFDNDKGGFRVASSVAGTNTGEGGDFIVCDDANSVKDSESDTIRNTVNDWWSYTMATRVANFQTARRLVAQQRTHTLDLSGHILQSYAEDWVVLRLPMEFERSNRCMTVPLKSSGKRAWRDPRMHDGDLLWPELINQKSLTKLKRALKNDSYRISGQLQQRPSPEGGGIIKTDWFQKWTEPEMPEFEYVLQSWDTALTTNQTSCYSACTTWGVWKQDNGIRNVMLLSVYREKVEYPELRKMAVRLCNNYYDTVLDDPLSYSLPVNIVYIEEKVSGYSLIQDLNRANIPVIKFDPRKYGDKVARCRRITYIMENGRVYLPTIGPHHQTLTPDSELFISSCSLFPNDESNDIIDSTSQAFIKMVEGDWVSHTEDPRPPEEEAWKQKQRKFY